MAVFGRAGGGIASFSSAFASVASDDGPRGAIGRIFLLEGEAGRIVDAARASEAFVGDVAFTVSFAGTTGPIAVEVEFEFEVELKTE